jgi:membrane-bound lytic murein transglycosylase MltF
MVWRLVIAIGFVLASIGTIRVEAQQPDADTFLKERAWLGDLDGMIGRRVIRIIVPYSKTLYFIDMGRQLGTAVEGGEALEKWLNAGKTREIERVRVAFVALPRDELLPALQQGLGDIVVANLTITPERRKSVDFTAAVMGKVKEIVVTGPMAPAISGIDDLGGKLVFVRKTSSYHEHLLALNQRLKATGKPEIIIHPIDENLEDEDILEMVHAGLLPWAIIDLHKAQIWSSVFPALVLREDLAIADGGEIAWAIRKGSPLLKAELDRFVEKHRIGTTFGNILRNRYFKDDKIIRRAYAPEEVEKFHRLVEVFRKHGAVYSFDYLMLIAQGYQESQLDQSRRSPRGAVGIMQLLPSTAADKSVGIMGIDASEDRNIEAGSKYLRHLIETYLDEPGLDERNRQLLAFAAYNAGPGNLRKFRRKAVELGLSPDIWFGNVENGAAAVVGRETVQYVSNIFKYYIAYRLLEARVQEREEAQRGSSP